MVDKDSINARLTLTYELINLTYDDYKHILKDPIEWLELNAAQNDCDHYVKRLF